MHYGEWAIATSEEEAIQIFKNAFPDLRSHPNEEGYARWHGYDIAAIERDLGVAFRAPERMLFDYLPTGTKELAKECYERERDEE